METTTKTGKERDRLERDELLQPFSSFLFIFFPRFSFYFAIRSLFFSTAALALNRWNVQTLFRFFFLFCFFPSFVAHSKNFVSDLMERRQAVDRQARKETSSRLFYFSKLVLLYGDKQKMAGHWSGACIFNSPPLR